jgi:uncharacterized NTF2-like protein DUF6841
MTTHTNQRQPSVREEVTHWFFDDYLPTWIGVGAGTIARGPEFILDYWAAPLHYGDGTHAEWFADAAAVIDLLEQTQTRLKQNGYTHTDVPDHQVRVYSDTGAAIEVIWSRCSADGEIERLAAHFEIALGPQGWRIVGIQTRPTTASSVASAWPDVAPSDTPDTTTDRQNDSVSETRTS